MKLRQSAFRFFESLTPTIKRRALFLIDLTLVVAAFFLAIMLRLNDPWPAAMITRSMPLLPAVLITSIIVGYVLNIHLIQLRSYETSSFLQMAFWTTTIAIISFVANIVFQLGAPRTVPIIMALLTFFMAASVRLLAINLLAWLAYADKERVPIAIYGAGSAGLQLLSALKDSTRFRPVLLVDDDINRQRIIISGLRVRAPSALKNFARSNRIKEVILAFPSLSPTRRQTLVSELGSLGCNVLELPSYEALLRSDGMVPALRSIDTSDLLGRSGIDLNLPELQENYADATVMISGAGGSIGKELCHKLLAIGARKIVLFERSELALYTIERDLRFEIGTESDAHPEIVPVLGSTDDDNRVRQVLSDHNIDILLHAAAYKHVPLVEANTCEGVRNNVLGVAILAQAAAECGVQRFIMISSDKAVRPFGIMGASKRLAELVVQDIQSRSESCVFGIVRFGNVLDSSGSVIPLFREQIKRGGPVTVTHTEVTRYFMTVHEAAFLVLLAGTFAENGEVFVLDMGEPVRIEELARRMITLSGLTVRDQDNPDGDVAIELTGLRDGEKLYEELLVGEDSLPTPHSKILRAGEKTNTISSIPAALESLRAAVLKNDVATVEQTIRTIVEDFEETARPHLKSAAYPA